MDTLLEILKWLDRAFEKHGPWFIIALALFSLGVMIVKWIGPRLDKLIDAHLDDIRKNKEQLQTANQSMKVHSKQLKKVISTQDDHTIVLKDTNQKVTSLKGHS